MGIIKDLFDFSTKDEAPYGSDVSAGTYECADCGHRMTVGSVVSLPPCPKHGESTHSKNAWKIIAGQGDAKEDPYPER
jgi:hypothetical protein